MAVDHDRARELHGTSLRALMEAPPNTELFRLAAGPRVTGAGITVTSINSPAIAAADWIDAVLTAWERGER